MSSIAEFATKVKEMLGKAGYEVEIREILKVNQKYLSILFLEKNISPQIYLEKFYYQYISGVSLAEVCDNIINVVEQEATVQIPNLCKMHSFCSAKESIRVKLINTSKNAELLQNVPHRELEDLSIVYYIFLDQSYAVQVKNDFLRDWDVSEEDLWKAANMNMARCTTFTPMVDVIQNLEKEIQTDESFLDDAMLDSSFPMYVLSNTWSANGAGQIILFDEVAELLKQHGMTEVYLLPSSIHEWIIVPCQASELKFFESLVSDANRYAIAETDFLSDNIYQFNVDSKKFSLIK